MQNPRIQDINSFKKLLENAESIEQVKRALPLFKPVLKLLGVNVAQMEQALARTDSLAAETRELVTLHDRFNNLFATRGWIFYEMLNYELAKKVVATAEAGDVDQAEEQLVEYYNEETLRWNLNFMLAIEAFRPRFPLAQKAMTDYVEGRYYACVPVVLALLDGTVNDLSPRGFFAEGVNLEAWDSIAAHSNGLAVLSKTLGRKRTKTTTEQISLPYRHGILHGMDLGFDNKLVAAKAWAAFFSIRDWAIKVERKQVTEPQSTPVPKKGIREIYNQLKELEEEKKRLAAWTPRNIKPGENLPSIGMPEDYEDGSPEQKLVEFLYYWTRGNYGHMARCLPSDERQELNKAAGQLREHYQMKKLQAFEVLEVSDDAAAVTTAKVKLSYDENGVHIVQVSEVRIINEDAVGNPVARGKPGSSWTIYTSYL